MVDFIIGDMLAPNIQIETTQSVIAGNLSVTGNSLPTNGLYLSGAGNLAIATNSTQKMYIDGNGNLYVQGNGQIFQGNVAMPTLTTVLTYQLAL